MRILIDIGHPAHVHLFKNFAWELQKKGHSIQFTTRDKEITLDLLKAYNLPFINFGKTFKGLRGKIRGLFIFNWKMLKVCLKFKPDVLLSHGSIYAAQVSFLIGKPHISMEDTGNMEQIRLYLPFTKAVLTSNSFKKNLGKKQVFYSGYHELCYLHPQYFVPDISVIKEYGLPTEQKYVLMRFVSWNATHDIGHEGISTENKLKAIHEFEKYAKVYVSSEKPLPEEFNKYILHIPPHKMHHVISFASMVFGESATMVSEGAVLGVPGIYLDNTGRFYTQDEEKYGIVFNFTESEQDQFKAIEKGIEILKSDRSIWKQMHLHLLADKINVTAFMVWFTENYPNSLKIIKNNTNYPDTFKSM